MLMSVRLLLPNVLLKMISMNTIIPQLVLIFLQLPLKLMNKSIKTHIWDTAGQDSFASIISTYYRGIAAAVIVFDVTRKSSFNKCSFWLDQININNGTSGYYPTLMLVGNKIDKSTRSVTYQEAKTFADKNNMIYYETSAKNNTNTNIFYQKTK